MDQSKKRVPAIIAGIIAFIIVGLVLFFSIKSSELPSGKKTSVADSIVASSVMNDTVAHDTGPMQPQTIVIENVKDNRQLAEVLDIIEGYSIENNIRDLKINCYREKTGDSVPVVPHAEE